VQTRTADHAPSIRDGHALIELGGLDGRLLAGGPAPDDEKVVVGGGHA
jgi:hypothetical protein